MGRNALLSTCTRNACDDAAVLALFFWPEEPEFLFFVDITIQHQPKSDQNTTNCQINVKQIVGTIV
jgi:hypothetical protein